MVLLETMKKFHVAGVLTLSLSPDGKYLWCGGADGSIAIWMVRHSRTPDASTLRFLTLPRRR